MKVSGDQDMERQLHINVTAPTAENMEPITQAAWHPNGGLWTFTDDASAREGLPQCMTPFAFFTAVFANMGRLGVAPRYRDPRTNQPRPFKVWRLYPSRNARIAIIDNLDDLLELGSRYGWLKSCYERRVYGEELSLMPGAEYSVNFLAMAEDFDALHVTDAGVERLETPEAGDYRLAFWEAESTCWFRWAFERVEDVGFLADYQTHAHGDVFTILHRRRRSWIASGKSPG